MLSIIGLADVIIQNFGYRLALVTYVYGFLLHVQTSSQFV